MKRLFTLALAASVALCLSGCGTLGAQLTTVVADTAPALQIVISQDVQSGDLSASDAAAANDYLSAVQLASAALAGSTAACAGVDPSTCAQAALSQAISKAQALVALPTFSAQIGAAAGPRVLAALKAAQAAVLAAQDVQGAVNAQTAAQKSAYALAAVMQLNSALLQGLQAAA